MNMDRRTLLCVAILATSCLVSVPGVLSANKAAQLWQVMDDTKEDFGAFWKAVNESGFVQSPDFLELSEGDKTILAVSNSTLIRFAESYGVSLASVKLPNVTKLLYPLIEYHVVNGVQKFSSLPLKVPTSFPTMLAGKNNSLCATAGTVNITRVSSKSAVVTAGGSRAVLDLTADGPISSNDAYAVYAVDNILSPCCLDLDFNSLDLSNILNVPELRAYIKGLNFTSPIITKITGFLTFALQYIKANGDKLNKTPVTVVLPYPSVIAAALDTLSEDMKNQNTYAAIFLNHIIPQPIDYDTIMAANGSQTVQTMLDVEYGPFQCATSGVVASVDVNAEDYAQLMPKFGDAVTDTGYSLCSGSQVYFAQGIVMPCNLTDAIASVAGNLTAEVKKAQAEGGGTTIIAGGEGGSSTTPSSTPSTSSPAPQTKAASPATALSPRQWFSGLLAAVSMLLVLLL